MKILDNRFELYAQRLVWMEDGSSYYVTVTQALSRSSKPFFVEVYTFDKDCDSKIKTAMSTIDLGTKSMYDAYSNFAFGGRTNSYRHETLSDAMTAYRSAVGGDLA